MKECLPHFGLSLRPHFYHPLCSTLLKNGSHSAIDLIYTDTL